MTPATRFKPWDSGLKKHGLQLRNNRPKTGRRFLAQFDQVAVWGKVYKACISKSKLIQISPGFEYDWCLKGTCECLFYYI